MPLSLTEDGEALLVSEFSVRRVPRSFAVASGL